MNERPNFSIVMPSNTLKLKAERPGGISREQALEAANAVLQAATGEFYAITVEEVEALREMVKDMLVDDSHGVACRRKFYKKAHDIWAQGTTFNYPIITDICGIMCEYMESVGDRGHIDEGILILCLSSLKLMISRNRRGPGSASEVEMVEGLRKAVAKVVS